MQQHVEMQYVFNPEHDLCLANGTSTYIPSESALKFGRDCHSILDSIMEDDGSGLVVWGWNPSVRKKLVHEGISAEILPSDAELETIRALSHRKTALEARRFIHSRMPSYTDVITGCADREITELDEALGFINEYKSTVFKAPWSGSGKGLRWIRQENITASDKGWIANTIARQGSVIAEERRDIVQDFAMLFHIGTDGVHSEGLSLFKTTNGAYGGNILASDRYIMEQLSAYMDVQILHDVRSSLTSYLGHIFTGKYKGFLGVDMYICKDRDRTMLCPCSEINVRMTMGLLARRYFDRKETLPDGKYVFSVITASDGNSLAAKTASALRVLTPIYPDTRYAVAITPL